jgi:hypothetical protein
VAFVDREGQPVVIQVVYDGPPEAGKTTSVRALARSFGREAYTPEEENGRTVYFDWLEHTGGRFEGAPIHCQIASVPGQDRWLERRLYFLERADVVVFVGDTTRAGWPGTVEWSAWEIFDAGWTLATGRRLASCSKPTAETPRMHCRSAWCAR